MAITTTQTEETWTVSRDYAVHGATVADAVKQYPWLESRKLRPTSVTLNWVDGELDQAHVRGPLILTGGRDSDKQAVAATFYGGHDRANWPAWLIELIELIERESATI